MATGSFTAELTGESGYGDTLRPDDLSSAVDEVLATTRFIDMHTHLFPPAFGKLGLWGIDELLTYHLSGGGTVPLLRHQARAVLAALQAPACRPYLEGFICREQSGLGGHSRGDRGSQSFWPAHCGL